MCVLYVCVFLYKCKITFQIKLFQNSWDRLSPEEKKFNMVRSIGEECIKLDELMNLLTKKPEPIAYDGFEPSGRMHIAQVYIFQFIHFNK